MLIFFFGESPLLEIYNARKIKGQDAWGLNSLILKHSDMLQIQAPDLYIIESSYSFSFAIGFLWKTSAVCMTTGLLKKLTEDEIEATLAHQICQIYRMSTFNYSVIQVIAYTLVGLGRFLDKLWIPNLARRLKLGQPLEESQIQTFFTRIFSPIAWIILKISLTEKDFFEIDEMAAALLKDRKTLADALWKLEGLSQTHPQSPPACTHHFFIVNPLGTKIKKELLLTHPKIDIRIKRLIGYFPI